MQDQHDLIEGLRRSPAILSGFVESIPGDKLDLRRGDGFWTIAEHVSHLAQVQPMLLERIKRFISEESPEFIPYIPGDEEDEPDTPERMDMSAALDQFAAVRADQLRTLEKAGDAVWSKEGAHPEYERYSLYILIRHLLIHDHWHMYRMEELWLTRDTYLTSME